MAPRPPVIDPADRFSQLPPEIQAQIVSLLPAQEAVRTCVLARTWRGVWKLTRRLLITGDEGVCVQDAREFVDRLLRLGLKDHGPIDAWEIVFNWCDDDDGGMEISRTVWSWIRHILECQIQSLRVDIWDGQCIPMSKGRLASQYLTRLELSGLWFDFYAGNSCLNLSSCPALEHLEITDCSLVDLIKVKFPSVKRLVIKGCVSFGDDHIQICFPQLVSLWLEDFNDMSLVLGSMPQLAVAYVSIDYNLDILYSDDYGQNITECLVLQGLAEAKHLVLLSTSDKTLSIFRFL